MATTVSDVALQLRTRVVDFGELPLEQQLRVVQETDILVGLHGAGLAHLVFLPEHAVVVEMFPKIGGADEKKALSFTRQVYRNLALHMGRVREEASRQKCGRRPATACPIGVLLGAQHGFWSATDSRQDQGCRARSNRRHGGTCTERAR